MNCLATYALQKQTARLAAEVAATPSRKCTADTIQLRPEYRTLSTDQKLAFVAVVRCVMVKPSRYPLDKFLAPDVDDLENSPVFDGSATSMGGNGAYISHERLQLAQPAPAGSPPGESVMIQLQAGTGGGCVSSDGPLGSLTVGVGPVAMLLYGTTELASDMEWFQGRVGGHSDG
ncbi:hypothetical protein SBRCBS47491_007573 [Sporothrix bragantina]|uniref:Uncharacterized protein n=1 Tax=Sporothrix bragantina TaxID=671064 RepID=A0ABP0CG73_9PEZI